MNHKENQKWIGRLYAHYDVWGMRREDIAKFGDPKQIAAAHTLKEPTVSWVGGNGDCDSTLDIGIIIESQSGKLPYLLIYKLSPTDEEDTLDVVSSEIYPKHFCEYEGFKNGISRLPGPCKHRIRGRMFLEENLRDISRLGMKRNYGYYDDPRLFWLRKQYNPNIMAYYNHLVKSRTDLDAIQIRDILNKYLFYDWKFNKRFK